MTKTDNQSLPVPFQHEDISSHIHEGDFIPGRQKCHFNGKPYSIDGKSLYNAGVILTKHPNLSSSLIYDVFADDIKLIKCPPWENAKTFKVHSWGDDDNTNFRVWLETCGFKLGKGDIADIISTQGRKNTVNPPKDYFEGLEWDGEPRLDDWLIYYCGAEFDKAEYVKMIAAKWMIGVVSRIYEAGCKLDTALILEGPQYAGKSSVFSTLATIGGESYFTDEHVDLKNKDGVMKLQGKLIYEMAELVSFRRAETEEIKSFITRRIDMYRPPYARRIIERPRMFAIGGSTNPTGGYLTDPTGNRRYWCVRVGKIDLDGLTKAREQLWAEAVARYKAGEKIWMTTEQYLMAREIQTERVDEDVYSGKIDDILNSMSIHKRTEEGFQLDDILSGLNINTDRWSNKLKGQIQNHLTHRNYILRRKRQYELDNVQQVRKWFYNVEGE